MDKEIIRLQALYREAVIKTKKELKFFEEGNFKYRTILIKKSKALIKYLELELEYGDILLESFPG